MRMTAVPLEGSHHGREEAASCLHFLMRKPDTYQALMVAPGQSWSSFLGPPQAKPHSELSRLLNLVAESAEQRLVTFMTACATVGGQCL